MTCRRVLLPDPDGPDDGDQLAGVDAQADPGEGCHWRVAGVLLDHVDQFQDRCLSAPGSTQVGAARVTTTGPPLWCRG